MNTTYRGFNMSKKDFHGKNRYTKKQDIEITQIQDANRPSFKPAERKRIINYMIEKGFAKKMEESLFKTRN